MDPIILDPALAARLADLPGPVEVLSPSGKRLGRFVPLIDLAGWVPLSPDISDGERALRKASPEPGLTTAEAIAYLGLDRK